MSASVQKQNRRVRLNSPTRDMYQELISLAPQRDGSSTGGPEPTRHSSTALELVEMGKTLTVQTIANQSGISKPTIYRYYNSPEEIERDAFWRCSRSVRSQSSTAPRKPRRRTDVRQRVCICCVQCRIDQR